MKKAITIITAAALILGSVASCSKLLDIPQHGVLNTENYYKTDEDALSAVAAIYAEFEDVLILKEFELGYNYINSYLSDEFWHGYSERAVDLEMLESFTFDADYPTIELVFTSLYNVIGKCNVVLDNVKGESDVQQRARAEAKVFRAWMYFELTTLWGNPPLVDHVLNPDEASVSNANPADLWKLMETDLTEAVNSGKLVSKAGIYDKSNYRVTKEYAQALLGKVYLWQGKNKEAAETLQEVIDSQKYDLFRGQYGDMFIGANQNNEEVVFSTHFMEDLQNPVIRLWPCSTGLSAYSRDGLNFTAGEPNELNLFANAWGGIVPRGSAYDAFVAEEGADGYRLNETIKDYDFMASHGYTIRSGYKEVSEGYYFWKGRFAGDDINYEASFPTVFRDICWMRYAEVLLLAAEAYIGVDQSKADWCLNEVRHRAGLGDKTCTLDAVKTEKRLELYGENIRYKDLLRWGDAATVLADAGKQFPQFSTEGLEWISPFTSYGFKKGKHERLPYPATEIMANKNIVQNEGWE
jgi:hypothetical protein